MEVALAALLLILLLIGTVVGLWFQDRLKEHHRSRDTVDSIRAIVTMLVTFAALVLGLLVTSVKADFDTHSDLQRKYGMGLIELDQRLRQYGHEADDLRALLRSFTAAVIAVTWPDEPAPAGNYPTKLQAATPDSAESVQLTAMLMQLDNAIEQLSPPDAFHQRVAAILQTDIRATEQQRWALIQGSHSKVSSLFLTILMFWLVAVFLIFGISSPRHGLTYFAIVLSAIAVSSALYLILDLDTPVGGFIEVSSHPLRDALWHMDHSIGSPPQKP